MWAFSAAQKFGATEFVNPKDHEKPIQQVDICKKFPLLATFLLKPDPMLFLMNLHVWMVF
jgi:hypothetical protein